jgi:solute:Na+ symporter, SSS family
MESMKLSHLDLSIFLAFLAAVLGTAVWASRRGHRTKRDYFLAGDNLSWWMIGGSIVAANVSSHHFVGIMGTAYASGFSSIVIVWGAVLLGFNALLWIFLPYYLRNGFYTMPEFLQRRYGTAARMIFASLLLFNYVFIEVSAVLYMGGLVIHSLLGIDTMQSIVFLALVTGGYTIFGGLRAVVWTEIVQLSVLIAGGVALAAAAVSKAGGWPAIAATMPHWHLLLPADDPHFPWTMFLGGLLCISVYYNAANQFIVQRTLAAKNEWHARMGVVFADYLFFLMPLIIILPGLVGPKLFPHLEKPDLIFPTLVANLLSPGLVGLVMAALIAAVMSHISGVINSCTTVATIDFYLPLIRKDATEAQAVRFGRAAGAVVILLGILFAGVLISHGQRPIFLYLLDAYGYFTPGIATMFLMGIFWKRTTQAGALTAGFLTIPLSIALQMAWPDMPFFNRTGIAFWICMGSCTAVSLFTKPQSTEKLAGLIWTFDSCKLPLEQRLHYRGLRRPVVWWAIITAVILFFYICFP